MQAKINKFVLAVSIAKIICKKHIFLSIPLILAGTLLAAGFALAESCPSNTTVSGTTVNFVGEVTDMGGDSTVTAWFEYSQSGVDYGQVTSQKVVSQTGLYCVTVSNLSACKTYHYRAVAQNSAGTSKGEDKTFTTTCGATVDLKANGSDGPVSVNYGGQVNLSWTSNSANSCVASGGWLGSKSVSGTQTIYNLTSSQTFTLTCTGSAGSDSDSVTVNVGSPSLSVSLSPSPSSGCAPLSNVDLVASITGNVSGNTTYYFDCTNDGSWEKIITSSSNSYTASDLCNYSSVGTYTVKVRVENQGVSAEDTENINILSCGSTPTVNLTANGVDGSVTIPYNTAANLSWTSNNANSCSASGNWSGNKAISGSESTGNLTSSQGYTITCTGSNGSNSDSVTVNVSSVTNPTVQKLVRNLSMGTGFVDQVSASPLDVVSFSITISAGSSQLDNLIVKETLPSQITWRSGTLRVDGSSVYGDIVSGYNLGSLSANQTRTITFDADVATAGNFVFGDTQLVNSVLVYNSSISSSDTAKIVVTRKAVAGATSVSTGLTDNLFVDSFLIPLAIALLLLWLLKSRIIKWEQWLDVKRKGYREYKSDKVLRLKTKKIRVQEFLKSKQV
jgi:hypothetical protein